MKLSPNVLIPEPFPPGTFLCHPECICGIPCGLDPGELWSKLPREVEPEQGEHEAVKKELLPQEDIGKEGRKWASVEPSSCKKAGRGKKFQTKNELAQGWTGA